MAKRKKTARPRSGSTDNRLRRWSRIAVIVLVGGLLLIAGAGDLYVHHSAQWLAKHDSILTAPLELLGDPVASVTDALGWTGRDAVNTPDDPAPEGMVFFAGAPVRTGLPCPTDITILDRGEFKIGWSPSLQHPVWVAYHVPAKAKFDVNRRPNFQRDRSVQSSPAPTNYVNSGYDRGHMVPNRAMITRFGPEIQKKTFLMTNVAPQRPSLNRGPWRELEQRISDLWTARYGEIWVIVGCYTPATQKRRQLEKSAVDIPENFYMVIAAQGEDAVRMLAVDLGQPHSSWRDEGRRLHRWSWPTHAIVSVDELESRTGLDFFPDMIKSLQTSLEAEVPTRLWPVRLRDIFKLIMLRFV